jgi:four helix bundle protein
MNSSSGERPYDLGERTFLFARQVREFVKRLPRTDGNLNDLRQLLRSSGSGGANYLEANECLGKKDFLMRMRIARKESKESVYWLRLLDTGTDAKLIADCDALVQEARELVKIFSAIIRKREGDNK